MSSRPDALVIGGGMVTADLILPSLYHLQRTGMIGDIAVCASRSSTLRILASHAGIRAAFPGSSFKPWPDLGAPGDETQPLLYRRAIESLRPRQMVVVAVPDHLHHEVVMTALQSDQHVLCVKPLALKHSQAVEIAGTAGARGLFVGVEYHKRWDRRARVARAGYRAGRFGELVMGEARLIEPSRYRSSNFRSWFTVENTDPFTYIGCHSVDLVRFITGLLPVAVSVVGIRRRFPNGNEGFLWSHARVTWENGALLSVTNGLGYPDQAAGSNDQGLLLYCEGAGVAGMIRHDDHFRGVSYAFADQPVQGSSFQFTSPDFFQLVPWEGEGLRPLGYGFDSIEAITRSVVCLEESTRALPPAAALEERRRQAALIDEQGIIATPSNSAVNELVVEAGRLSIMADGDPVRIVSGTEPRIERARQRGQQGGS